MSLTSHSPASLSSRPSARLLPYAHSCSAQDQLRDLLHPVTRYIISVRSSEIERPLIAQVLAQRHPRYLLRLHRWHDEAYLVLMLFLERHYLRHHLASFAENFYVRASLFRAPLIAIRV